MTIKTDSLKKPSLFDLAKLKKNGFKAGELIATEPQIRSKLMTHLGRTVRRDETTKNIVFDVGVSAYTRNPINLFLKGPSGIGKTYVATQTLKYFPSEDVWMLGGLSPKALIHGYGVLVDKKDKEIDFADKPSRQKVKQELLEFYRDVEDVKVDKVMVDREFEEAKKKWRERIENSRYIIDLQNKILVFLEAPHFETYNILRPILSHDALEISYKITDKTATGSLRTKHVVIKRWPATVFCSTVEKYIKDLATRGFTVTPQTEQAKYKDANVLTGEKTALPWKFREDFDFLLLQGFMGWLKHQLQTVEVVVPYGRELGECYPSSYARSMRDFKHFMALVEVSTLFHCMQRPVLAIGERKYVLATINDYQYVLGLWKNVEETTVTGLPGHILEFFHKAVESLSEKMANFSYEDLTVEYNEQANEKKSSDTVRKWVKHLCDIGWLTTEPDPVDKRKVVVRIIKNPKINGDYRIPLFQDFFNEESLRTWFDDAQKISETNLVLIKENFISDKSYPINALYKRWFCSDIFSEHSNAKLNSKGENRAVNIGFQQSPTIPKTLSFDALNLRDGPHQLVGEMFHQGECYQCKQTTQITAYFTDFKGNKQDLCSECVWAISKELEKRVER